MDVATTTTDIDFVVIGPEDAPTPQEVAEEPAAARASDPAPEASAHSTGTSESGPTTPAAGEVPVQRRDVGTDSPARNDPDLAPDPRAHTPPPLQPRRTNALARRLALVWTAISSAFASTSRSVAAAATDAATAAGAAATDAATAARAQVSAAAASAEARIVAGVTAAGRAVAAAWDAASRASLCLGAWAARPAIRSAIDAYLRIFLAASSALAVGQLWRLASAAATHARLAEAAAAAANGHLAGRVVAAVGAPAPAPSSAASTSASSTTAPPPPPRHHPAPVVTSWAPLESTHTARTAALQGAHKLGSSILKAAAGLEGVATAVVAGLMTKSSGGGDGGGGGGDGAGSGGGRTVG